jgi:hypothetical protein
MALRVNTAEGGTNTTIITTGNSGGASGDAWDAISASAFTFSSTEAMTGSLSMRTTNTALQAYARWNTTGTAYACRAYFWIGGSTTADESLISFFDAAGASQIAYIRPQGTGRVRFGTTGNSNVWTATNTYPTSQWLRFELYAVPGATTSDGIASLAYYYGHDTTPIESFSASNLNIGGGGGSFGHIRVGKGSGALAQYIYVDDVALDTAATGLLGPSVLPSFTWAHTVAQG